jgi:hypothetical protein
LFTFATFNANKYVKENNFLCHLYAERELNRERERQVISEN